MSENPGRREANKTRTREAVHEALFRCLRETPFPEITVDRIAEAADISRRTFFNYYAGIPAVLVEVFAQQAETLLGLVDPEALLADPIAALRDGVVARRSPAMGTLLDWMAVINAHDSCVDAASSVERVVWAELGGWLEDRLQALFPADVDPLYLTTLAGSVMHAFAAAEKAWLADRHTDRDDTDLFADHLDRALGHLADGWRRPSR